MQLGFIGLGKMGGNMVERLLRDKHRVVVYNRTADKIQEAVAKGATGSSSLKDLVDKLQGRKIVWLMVPSLLTSRRCLRRGTLSSMGEIPITRIRSVGTIS
jgi:6-phosphogluconate dehydrogenase (decarboxylating)